MYLLTPFCTRLTVSSWQRKPTRHDKLASKILERNTPELEGTDFSSNKTAQSLNIQNVSTHPRNAFNEKPLNKSIPGSSGKYWNVLLSLTWFFDGHLKNMLTSTGALMCWCLYGGVLNTMANWNTALWIKMQILIYIMCTRQLRIRKISWE